MKLRALWRFRYNAPLDGGYRLGRDLGHARVATARIGMILIRAFFTAVQRDNKLLSGLAWTHVVLAVVFLWAAPFDPRLISGINPWVKPFKFASSIALYSFTLAYLLRFLDNRRLVKWVSRGVAASMGVEIALITLQAARGVRSHFNQATALDGAIFGVMGVAILFNTLLDARLAWEFMKPQKRLRGGALWGVRLGLVLFVLGSLEGFVMVANMGHAVGAADGGPGLPLLNWSTQGGDLRIAHFFALHSLQVLPLFGYWLDRSKSQSLRENASFCVGLAALAYACTAAVMLTLALRGIPLVGM